MCGGTGYSRLGLSPRVRGNPERLNLVADDPRSIPARAGEPLCRGRKQDARGVYPRACGGTVFLLTKSARYFGLSPRVRGEPGRFRPGFTPRVYPRACGGTESGRIEKSVGPGLSPRVRGNPLAYFPAVGNLAPV